MAYSRAQIAAARFSQVLALSQPSIALGNAVEEAHRSGIHEPKAGADGKHSTLELAQHHARMAEHHTKKSGVVGQTLKRYSPFSKDAWQKLNPLHRNFWQGMVPGGNMIGGALNANSNKKAALHHVKMAAHYAGLHAGGTDRVYKRDEDGKFT